jgi:hypothetical protein
LAIRDAGKNVALYLLPGSGHDPAGEIEEHGAVLMEFLNRAMQAERLMHPV